MSRVTCVSISALMVNAHSIVAQQELHHLQVFSIGARTVTQDSLSPQRNMNHTLNSTLLQCISGYEYSLVLMFCRLYTVSETIPVKSCLAEYVLFRKTFCARNLYNFLHYLKFSIIAGPDETQDWIQHLRSPTKNWQRATVTENPLQM